MPQVNCLCCSKEFYAKPSWLKNGYGKYCSILCRSEANKNGKIVNCHRCTKEVYRSKKDQSRSKSGKYFCNKSCQTLWRNSEAYTADNHPNWTGGLYSYRDRLKRSEVTQECRKCKTTDERILAVHHKDKNRENNDLSNLIWLCHNCHYLVHHFKDESQGFVVPVA